VHSGLLPVVWIQGEVPTRREEPEAERNIFPLVVFIPGHNRAMLESDIFSVAEGDVHYVSELILFETSYANLIVKYSLRAYLKFFATKFSHLLNYAIFHCIVESRELVP